MSESESESDDTDAQEQDDGGDEPEEPEIDAPIDAEDAIPQAADEAHDEGEELGMGDFIQSGGIKEMLLQDAYRDPETDNTYSQADLIADIINVMRMDTKQMAKLHGIDIEVNKMSPEHAAELMQDVALEDGVGIIQVFEEIEDQRDILLQSLMTDEQHEKYMKFKKQMLYSVGADE